MIISTKTILSKIDSDFTSVYKPQSNFPDSGMLWDTCISTIRDIQLMDHIIFNNDVMKIPPVKTFLMANQGIQELTDNEEKKAIGAFWGFVFKFVFGYSNQKDNVPINTKGVKKAAYFYEAPSGISLHND